MYTKLQLEQNLKAFNPTELHFSDVLILLSPKQYLICLI